MTAPTSKLYAWALRHTESERAPLWVALLFALELFLFIPLDAVLMFFCLQNRRRIALYVLIAAVASTISALLGYFLGHFLWNLIGPYIVPYFLSPTTFDRFAAQYQQYEEWALFFGALVPLPLKILSLSAGIFHLKLGPVLGCVLAARFLRFSAMGLVIALWGDKFKGLVERHFRYVLLAVGAKVALGTIFFWALAR